MPKTTPKTTPKPTDTPVEPEPKQRPVKRPAKPAYHVPRGVRFDDTAGNPVRYRAGDTIDGGIVPQPIADQYLKRGDLVALTDH